MRILLLLLLPYSLSGAVQVGDSIKILRITHPYYGHTGVVVHLSGGGATLDYDGDGVRELTGGINLSNDWNWQIVNVANPPPDFNSTVGQNVILLTGPHYAANSGNYLDLGEIGQVISNYANGNVTVEFDDGTLTLSSENQDVTWQYHTIVVDPNPTPPNEPSPENYDVTKYVVSLSDDPSGVPLGVVAKISANLVVTWDYFNTTQYPNQYVPYYALSVDPTEFVYKANSEYVQDGCVYKLASVHNQQMTTPMLTKTGRYSLSHNLTYNVIFLYSKESYRPDYPQYVERHVPVNINYAVTQ